MEEPKVYIKLKKKQLFHFKYALCLFTRNPVWIENFINDIEDKPNRYFKVVTKQPGKNKGRK